MGDEELIFPDTVFEGLCRVVLEGACTAAGVDAGAGNGILSPIRNLETFYALRERLT